MESKITILYIVSTLKRCGPTNQLLNIVSNLNKDVFSGTIITLSPEADDSLMPKFRDQGIKILSLEMTRFEGILSGYKKLEKIVMEIRPDIVHTQGIRADQYAVRLKRLGVKTVSTIRCIPNEDYLMRYGPILGKWMVHHHYKSLRKHDQVVAVSRSSNRTLAKFNLDTVVIPNGCDLNKFYPATPDEKALLRRKLLLPVSKTLIISVGHLSTIKSPLTIIRAMKLLNTNEDFEMVFVGDGNLREKCEKEAEGLNGIHFVGRVTNVDEYLKASDIFISASLSEGLPNSVLECLACGIPTILSDIQQHRELFEESSSAALFFEVGNSTALAEILGNLTYSRLKSLPTRNIVENSFDSVKMSERYQSLYVRLLGLKSF